MLQTLNGFRPLGESVESLMLAERAIEVTPGGVNDLLEALKRGVPVYQADGIFMVSLARLIEVSEVRRLEQTE